MHDDREIIEARIQRTVRERIRPAIHGASMPLDVTAWVVPGEPVPVADARAATYEPFEVGRRWGRPWGTTWFRLRGSVPTDWYGETVEARVDLGFGAGPGFQSEGLVYDAESGGPIRGIHPLHQCIPIDQLGGGPDLDFLVEAASNPIVALSHLPTPLGDPATAGDEPQYRLRRMDLAVRNDDVWHLDLDLQILVRLMLEHDVADPRRHELLRTIEDALDQLDLRDIPATAAAASDVLGRALDQHASETAHTVTAIGHAHIDTAWLWPLRETRRKCARTFSSAVTWMETDYPEYRFACSQAVQYQWMEDDQPELFERIKAQVDAGRFIPVGSMWVEVDCNLPSGESLARQLVHGKRYFEDRFGIETTEVWIPDVFGYAGNLPQLMHLAGCEFFLTQKLSWNKTNRFPHNSFWWEGIDGTRIFTHFPPVDTYNAEVRPDQLRFAERNFRDKGRSTHTLMPFGHGDGGGGPTREMLERARRQVDLAGLPKVRQASPDEFFRDAVDEYGDHAAVWRGELYFEMHRGTYTSQAKTKQGNRLGELLLRELELWSAHGTDADLAALDRLWKTLLVHQFHDIIPGSSIAWVHDDTEADHAALHAELDDHIGEALWGIVGTGGIVAANAGPFAVDRVVAPTGALEGTPDPVWVSAPAMGIGIVSPELPDGVEPVTVSSELDDIVVDNGIVRLVVGPDGRLTSLFDHRAGRESFSAPANELQLFADHPNEYDAWDVEHFTLAAEPVRLLAADRVEVVESGRLRTVVRVERTFGASSIVQDVVVTAGSARVDIETVVDWHEDEKLLKAAFPTDVVADDARYDVQYGHVRRPLHRNTSWDTARFEVCGHQWADIADPDFGVAVLNDSRYGHDGLEQTLRLTLLRSANYPDPDADRGRHRFTYAVLPHDGRVESILPEAWSLNLPPRVVAGSTDLAPTPIVAVDHPGVVVTAVKPADDGSGDLVVRYHEARGGRADVVITVDPQWTAVDAVDLLERSLEPHTVEGGRVERSLTRFQVETLRFSRS